jgi:hypothetical protein
MNTTTETSTVQVINNHLGWFVREDGRTYPASFDDIAARFGRPFAEACVDLSGNWVEFDPTTPDDALPSTATVVERTTVGYMACVTIEDASGREFTLTDLASVFSGWGVGTTGVAWRDETGWNFRPDLFQYEPLPEPRPITTLVRKLDPAAWAM